MWLVELAPVTDPADVTSAVLSALGLREQVLVSPSRARRPMPETPSPPDELSRLLSALAAKRTLLVLDNCEHLVAAAAALADRVLAACPQVRIMATSREPLNITGEALWTVGPLTLPPDPAVTSLSAERSVVHDFASVRLLTQRARAVVPSFAVTHDNAPAVAAICRALDGMPLAIELAAARLRTMAPEQIEARLGDRFQLLSSGSRTAMPRHQTLRAVVDWSWDLLDDAERALWRRFSVFTGGATLEAAEQVCSGSGLPAARVLDLLTALAEKSLLTVRHDPPRYRMLEIIRAYGQERLAEAGEQEEVREAHAQYFTRLAEASQDHLLRAEQLDWLEKLSADQDNLHAAIRGAVAAGDGPAAVRLAAALGWYWSLRSMKVEGAELIAEAVSVPGAVAAADPENLAVAYAMGALLAMDTPLRATGLDWLDRAAALAARITDPVNPIMPLLGPLAALFGAPDPAPGSGQRPVGPDVFDDAASDPIRGWPRSPGSCAGIGRSTSVGGTPRRKRISWPRRASWPSWGSGGARRWRSAAWPCWKGGGASTPSRSAITGRPGNSSRRSAAPRTSCSSACSWCGNCGWPASGRRPGTSCPGRCPTPSGSACPSSGPLPSTPPATSPAWTAGRGRARGPGPGGADGHLAGCRPADPRGGRHRARLPGRRRRRPGRGPRLARSGAGRRPVLGRRAGDRRGPDRAGRSRAARERRGAGRRAARSERRDPGNHGPFGPR